MATWSSDLSSVHARACKAEMHACPCAFAPALPGTSRSDVPQVANLMSAVPAYAVIADRDCLRWQCYERELRSFWEARNQAPLIQRIDWQHVIDREGRIESTLQDQAAVFRVESPGRMVSNAFGFRRLGEGQQNSGEEADAPAKGEIVSPRLVYAGLQKTMNGLAETLQATPRLRTYFSPHDVSLLFDKNRTTARLVEHGLPCPATFEHSASSDELLTQLRERGWRNAFVKLAYGSCASGIVVVSTFDDPPSGITTVAEIDGRFLNTSRLVRVEGDSLQRVLDFIAGEGATVQQAVPKTTTAGLNFDVRVVVVGKEIGGTVFRASPHPITNLHLGGRRADPESCRRVIPRRHWLDAIDCCLQAATLFELPTVGIDVAFDRTSGHPYILEINAFGDFFPNWVNHKGRSIHSIEIEETAKRFAML